MTATRPTDHRGLEVLTTEESLALLAGEPVGRLAFLHEGEPVILPVNHRLDGWTIVFRSDFGAKLAAAAMEQPVAFEVDRYDRETRTGSSVLVRGVAEVVYSHEVEERLDDLGLRTWAGDGRDQWVRIHPEEITGRRIGAAGTGDRPAAGSS